MHDDVAVTPPRKRGRVSDICREVEKVVLMVEFGNFEQDTLLDLLNTEVTCHLICSMFIHSIRLLK